MPGIMDPIKPDTVSRRKALKSLSVVGMAAAASSGVETSLRAAEIAPQQLKGNVNHSVCKWCYPDLSLEELAQAAAQFGMHSVELLNPDQYEVVKKHGLVCAMANGPGASPRASIGLSTMPS